jgi:feruloyl esterase
MILPIVAATLSLGACGSGDGQPPDPLQVLRGKCASLASAAAGASGVQINSVAVLPASGAAPEYCSVNAQVTGSQLKLQLNLPTSGWNGKLAFLGGGGFDGNMAAFNPSYNSASIQTERYATIGTNGGHDDPSTDPNYFKASFASDPQQLADYTYLADHRALPYGESLLKLFYGSDATKRYFEGCSMGGHDALIEAQRYPDDFDGIVARAPAGDVLGIFTQFNRIAKAVRTLTGNLSPGKQSLLANAVLSQCDGLDGLTDGIISNPAACTFDPQALRCPGGTDAGDSCLSDAQIATVNAITTPYSTTDGTITHPGYNFGLENSSAGWGAYIWPQLIFGGNSLQGLFSDGFIRSFITHDQSYDTAQFDANQWEPQLSAIGTMFQAFDPDLTGLHARKGKLILLNGTNDTSVSPRDSARYYDSVVGKLGATTADNTVELFLEPGVGHCTGGPGPDQVDLLKAVSTWTETGVAPSRQNLTLAKLDSTGKTVSARPLCKYPAFPRYNGSGNVNDPASYTCATH